MKMPSFADKTSYHVAIITLLALCILGIGSHYLLTGSLNTTAIGHTMNDQVGYVTAARNLADSGRLESSLYYPALLNYYKSHNLLYMPGNYYIRALFFSIFGYSTFVAFLPNLLSFVGSAVVLFLIARHLFNNETAYMSAICFMLFPPVVLYAYSAMMEILIVFFCLLAVFIFLKIPQRVRFILGGLTLVLPYVIRESALLMLPGFAAMIYLDSNDKPTEKSLFFVFSSLSLIYILKKIPYISNIPPHFTLSLVNISGLYNDAFAVKDIRLSYGDTLLILLDNLTKNLSFFKSFIFASQYWPAGFTFYLMVLVLSFICLIIVLFNKKIKKAFAYFTLATALLTIAITFSVLMYFMNSGIRQILFVVPFLLCIIFYALLTSEISKRRGLTLFLLSVILVSCFFLFFISLRNFKNDFVRANAYERKCNDFLDLLGVSKVSFFVAPHNISLDYVNNHYPIKWSFIPANEKTLKLLSDRFTIDMLIIPVGDNLIYENKSNTVKASLGDGKFIMKKAVNFSGQSYIIYEPENKQALTKQHDMLKNECKAGA
jgi:hypothetical protein